MFFALILRGKGESKIEHIVCMKYIKICTQEKPKEMQKKMFSRSCYWVGRIMIIPLSFYFLSVQYACIPFVTRKVNVK